MTSALEYLGDEIRRARDAAGLTQEQLAKLLHCSRSLVAMYESGQRIPDPETVNKIDEALGTNGYLSRMRAKVVVPEANPEWFVPWLYYEQNATELGLYEPLLVPGLL